MLFGLELQRGAGDGALFDGDVAADDEKATFGNPGATVNVVVDSASAQMLQGATLDYKDGLNQAADPAAAATFITQEIAA